MSATAPVQALLPWASSVLGVDAAELVPVAGDASHRRYFRLIVGGASYIAVESPPATEKNAEFLALRATLERGGVRVPALYAADLERGLLLLGDLGDRLLLPELNEATVDGSYRRAFEVLLRLGSLRPQQPWPDYGAGLLAEELGRFPEWFAARLLARPLDAGERARWAALCTVLIDSALEQPRVLVHRDFHSRNLMPQADGSLGVIDFQDAVIGPITYDPVSLLRDCYIRWPRGRVQAWALEYRQKLRFRGELAGVSDAQFLRWFDLMGLQRHLKVLGTFARLYLRDNKPGYLVDLPRVIGYVEEVVQQYRALGPEMDWFGAWFAAVLRPLIDRQSWSCPQ